MEVVTEDLDYNNLLNVSGINHAEVVYDLRNVPVHVCGHSCLISSQATNLDINWLPETINKYQTFNQKTCGSIDKHPKMQKKFLRTN